MHEVVPQPMCAPTAKQEDSDGDDFWEEMEVFFSSLDLKQSTPSSEEHKLQQHEESLIIPVAPKEVTHEHKDRMEVISPSEEEESSSDQLDVYVVEHNRVVEVECLDPMPSRGCPIRYLALQHEESLPVTLIPEHEDELCTEAS